MVQLEAMLCGRPVVSTDLPTGVPWVNVHGETGLVVPAGDVASLRAALHRLVADAELERRARRSRSYASLNMFTADRMCCFNAGALSRRGCTCALDAAGGGESEDGGWYCWRISLMKSPQWPRRVARTVRELALRVATRGRGVPLTVNGLPVRVDAGRATGFLANMNGRSRRSWRRHILAGSEVWNVGANIGVYALQLGAWVGPDGLDARVRAKPVRRQTPDARTCV